MNVRTKYHAGQRVDCTLAGAFAIFTEKAASKSKDGGFSVEIRYKSRLIQVQNR